MDNLFLLLMLSSIGAFIAALIKPLIFQKIFKKKATRKNLSIYFIGSTITFFILFGITVNSTKQKTEVTAPIKTNEQDHQSQAQQEKKQSVSHAEQKTEEQSKITTKTGSYEEYTYTILEEGAKKEKVVTFQPFLPRNDDVLIGAIRKVTSQTFGNDDIKSVIPTTEERNGVNLILFNTSSGKYYYFLVKEETGEVNSFSFWKE